jgi:hypothetical protein
MSDNNQNVSDEKRIRETFPYAISDAIKEADALLMTNSPPTFHLRQTAITAYQIVLKLEPDTFYAAAKVIEDVSKIIDADDKLSLDDKDVMKYKTTFMVLRDVMDGDFEAIANRFESCELDEHLIEDCNQEALKNHLDTFVLDVYDIEAGMEQ